MSNPVRKFLIAVVALAAFAASTLAGGGGDALWSRGFLGTPSSGPFLPFKIIIIESITGNHLRAHCEYANYSDDDRPLETIMIDGIETDDGTFYPHVFAKVTMDTKGEWIQIGELGKTGKPASRRIASKAIDHDWIVDLDIFRPLIGKFIYGAVVLPTGQSALFELKDLLPPEPASSPTPTVTLERSEGVDP